MNLDELREVAWSGISPELRPKCWKLLLNYLPPNRSVIFYIWTQPRTVV